MIPKFREIENILFNENAAIRFLIEKGIIYETRECTCGNVCHADLDRRSYRCGVRTCRKEVSIFKHSFFYQQTLPKNEILHLGHLWLCGASVSVIRMYLGFAEDTIIDYFAYFRRLVADSLDELDFLIGGEGVIVEIDESKFGKRKYHRGHSVDGVWIFGGVERTPERKMFLVEVPDRSEDTLLHYIGQHIRQGSIIYSDLWRGYSNITSRLSMRHYTVNHSENFVDPITGVHTNSIEGNWAGLKRRIPVRCRVRSSISEHLLENIWRRNHENSLWDSFLLALKDVSYD
jgi:ISXO2-like transposase domain